MVTFDPLSIHTKSLDVGIRQNFLIYSAMHFKLSIVLELHCSHQSAHQMPLKDTILVSAHSTPVKLRGLCFYSDNKPRHVLYF